MERLKSKDSSPASRYPGPALHLMLDQSIRSRGIVSAGLAQAPHGFCAANGAKEIREQERSRS